MALNAATREKLKTLYNALSDRVLEPDDPVYVPEVNCRGDTDAVGEIANEIDWQSGGGVCLFTGQRGTGKSTELKRLKQVLETQGATVYYVDLSEFILLTKEIEISDFLISVAGAMSEAVAADLGASPSHRSYWARLTQFLQSEVNLEGVGAKWAVAPGLDIDIKASLKSDPDFKLQIQKAARGHLAKLVKQAHEFMAEAVQFVRDRKGDPHRKVVLLVDSVERIRGVGSDAMNVFESVRNLFFGHAEHLRIPALHVVYTVPPYLSVLAAGAGLLIGGAVTRRLVSTHIFQDRSRNPDPSGLEVLRTLIDRRHSDWKSLISPAALDQLALSSGGDLREFFRLIRFCLPAVRDESQLPLSEDAVKPAITAVRNELLPIPADHLTWLKRISQTHETCLKADADLPVLAHFLDNRLILNYRNGSDWYDVHPLLREAVDAYVSPGP